MAVKMKLDTDLTGYLRSNKKTPEAVSKHALIMQSLSRVGCLVERRARVRGWWIVAVAADNSNLSEAK